jgi:hypothetical protein
MTAATMRRKTRPMTFFRMMKTSTATTTPPAE